MSDAASRERDWQVEAAERRAKEAAFDAKATDLLTRMSKVDDLSMFFELIREGASFLLTMHTQEMARKKQQRGD